MSVFIGTTTPVPTLANVNAVRRDIQDTDYTILPSEYLISIVSLTAARTMTLPNAVTQVPIGKMYIIKDETLTAATNNIFVKGVADQPIDTFPDAVINTNGGSLTVVCNGTSWYIV